MDYFVIKRDGRKELADISKIIRVLQEADRENESKTPFEIIIKIANEAIPDNLMTTNEIRDRVETLLIENNCSELAKKYIIGCYKEQARRNRENLDKNIMGLINQNNEELMNENANKNPTIVSTQRDLIAGEVSKDIASRFIFPADVMEAHNKKAIHIHDLDYAAQYLTNCELLNIKDMLDNGTVINNVKIDRPKSLRTAMTLVSQISASVSSQTYGGQSISLAHIAPYVDVSRKKIKKQVQEELEGLNIPEDKINEITEERLKREIKDSVQTVNYQWSTISSTNGLV